jgi:hypothetical protein
MKTRAISMTILAALLAASCASYRTRTESLPTMPPNAQAMSGKSVAILPTTLSFGAGRLALDLRDVKLTVNGQEVILQKRFIATDDDMSLGKVGVLDVDILTKAKVDKAEAADFCAQALAGGLSGARDYNVPFFKGLGESNMGMLSNRPYEVDNFAYPPVSAYLPATGPTTLFSSVKTVPSGGAGGADLVFASDISISSEILEVIEPGSSLSPDDKPLMKGDYFLSLFGSYRFSLKDAATGAVLVDEKTKSEWTTKPVLVKYYRIPVSKGDADAYAKYFRSVDFEPFVEKALAAAIESELPLLAPFYVNTYHAIKVEKK